MYLYKYDLDMGGTEFKFDPLPEIIYYW